MSTRKLTVKCEHCNLVSTIQVSNQLEGQNVHYECRSCHKLSPLHLGKR